MSEGTGVRRRDGRLRAVFFDWSGTLADDLGPVIEATNAVLEHHGVAPLDRDGFRAKFQLPYTKFYDEMVPGASLEELEAIFRHHHAASRERCFLLPGAVDMLRWCREQGLAVYLCSSVHEEGWRQQAGELGVVGFFDEAHTGIRDKVSAFGQLLADHGLAPAETVFIGDMIHDVEAAAAHRVPSIALTHGYDSREKLERAGADFICEDLAEVRGVLMGLDRLAPLPATEVPATLEIVGLRLSTRLGVPEAERAQAQEVELDLRFEPRRDPTHGADEIGQTVDYAVVAERLRAEAGARPRRLLETLGADLAKLVLREFPVRRVELSLRKFVLPDARGVELRLVRCGNR